MEGERPSSAAAPSIWYAAVAVPHRKSRGKAPRSMVTGVLSGIRFKAVPGAVT